MPEHEPGPTATPEAEAAFGVDVDVSVRFAWKPQGALQLDDQGKLAFPRVPRTPGIYRLTLHGVAGSVITAYVGETDNLRRRFGNYRNADPSQKANQRLNERLHTHLHEGGQTDVAIADHLELFTAGDAQTADLTKKAARALAESAALVDLAARGVRVENVG